MLLDSGSGRDRIICVSIFSILGHTLILFSILIQSMNSTQVLLESINEFVDYTTDYLRAIPEVVVQGHINETIDQLQRQRYEIVYI